MVALPIGGTVEFNQYKLNVKRILSDEGYTSLVYEGELVLEDNSRKQVAIKQLKVLDIPAVKEQFDQEAKTLARFMHEEKTANQFQRTEIKTAPIFYGKSEINGFPYIVMEFINGETIPDVTMHIENFQEKNALTAAWQLFRVIDIMHVKLHKTFIDLKYENLWWVENNDNGGGILKVTDLGTLADLNEASTAYGNPRIDLLRASVFLFHMLTGYKLDYSIHGLNERIEPLLNQYAMSWGTKVMLRKLLHRNPTKRLNTAKEISNELFALVDYWSKDNQQLIDIAKANISKALDLTDPFCDEARVFGQRARIVLGIVETRENDACQKEMAQLLDQVNGILAKSDNLEIGKNLFHGSSYKLAREKLEQGMYYAEDSAPYRRWAYASSIGEHISNDVFLSNKESLLQQLNKMEEQRWESANEGLKLLGDTLNSPGLDALINESQLFFELNNAEFAMKNNEFKKSVSFFNKADRLLSKLPYKDVVIDNEMGNLNYRVDEALKLSDTREKAQESLVEVNRYFKKKEPDAALVHIREAFHYDPSILSEDNRLINLAKYAIDNEWFTPALQISQLANNLPEKSHEAKMIMLFSKQLFEAEELFNQDKIFEYSETIVLLLEQYNRYSEYMAIISRNIERKIRVLIENNDIIRLSHVNDLIKILPPEIQVEVKEKINNLELESMVRYKKQIDKLIAEITAMVIDESENSAPGLSHSSDMLEIMSEIDSRKAALTKAQKLIFNAAMISGHAKYRVEDIKTLSDYVKGEIKIQSEKKQWLAEKIDTQSQEKRNELMDEWESIKQVNDLFSKMTDINLPRDVYQQIQEQIADRVNNYIQDAFGYITKIKNDDDMVNSSLDEAYNLLDSIGEKGWINLRERADKRLKQIVNDKKQIFSQYQAGDLGKTAVLLDKYLKTYSKDGDLLQLKNEISKVKSLIDWQEKNKTKLNQGEMNPQIIHRISQFSECRIPKQFWNFSEITKYLEKVSNEMRGRSKRYMQPTQTEEFLTLLSEWINVEAVAHKVRTLIK